MADKIAEVVMYIAIVLVLCVLVHVLTGCAVTMPIGKGGELGAIRGSIDYVPPFYLQENQDIPRGYRK